MSWHVPLCHEFTTRWHVSHGLPVHNTDTFCLPPTLPGFIRYNKQIPNSISLTTPEIAVQRLWRGIPPCHGVQSSISRPTWKMTWQPYCHTTSYIISYLSLPVLTPSILSDPRMVVPHPQCHKSNNVWWYYPTPFFSFSFWCLIPLDCQDWREVMRGDIDPLGTVSIWSWVSISLGLPLNLRDLEHLTIETRLITESIECVIGECVSTFIINR